MFTGIIQSQGKIVAMQDDGLNKTFWIESDLSNQIKIDESLSHDGVCLTIEDIQDGNYKVTAVKETLDKTNVGLWHKNQPVNLERAMLLNDRLNGHIVQGHIDTTATCINKKDINGSYELTFTFNKKFGHLLIEKGSICINGVSLTAFNVGKKKFTVAIIPYTWQNTNLCTVEDGTKVNIEFDILGKYAAKMMNFKNHNY